MTQTITVNAGLAIFLALTLGAALGAAIAFLLLETRK